MKSQKTNFTKPEIKVFESYKKYGLEYTGDRTKWVKFKDGCVKNPDFIIKDKRIVIEVFGDYWHKGEDPNILIKKYNEIGYYCIVLWESDIKSNSLESLKELIDSIINQLHEELDSNVPNFI
jgi:G:T-mismatch repair DNA endonuclease (very short patch repair protein)